ncbi:hypothetical protein JB92DRAFT_1304134 [Gautieria morchelliformis]|nr:hypothetical protein JB92DRAFT_1304134 [Gautieria morchelliformis]
MPMDTPQADAQVITRLVASKYYLLASIVTLYFDHVLTFGQEVKSLWRRPASVPGVLFLLNRYYPLLVYAVVLLAFKYFPFAAPLVSEAILGLIVVLRLFALYGRNFMILSLLVPAYITQLVLGGWASVAIVRDAGLPQGSGCIVTVPTELVYRFAWLWASQVVFDTMVFGLTASRIIFLRKWGLKMPLTTLFLRDGLIYFAVMFSAKLLNFLLFWSTVTSNLVTLNWAFNNIITIIMVNRLVLNLREEGSRSTVISNNEPDHSHALSRTSAFVV